MAPAATRSSHATITRFAFVTLAQGRMVCASHLRQKESHGDGRAVAAARYQRRCQEEVQTPNPSPNESAFGLKRAMIISIRNGATALSLAAEEDHVEIVQLLLKNGANVSETKE
jgi:hypothetical protein